MPLGSLQKGSFDVTGAVVEIVAVNPPDRTGPPSSPADVAINSSANRKVTPEWKLLIKPASYAHPIELGVESRDEAIDWCNTIK